MNPIKKKNGSELFYRVISAVLLLPALVVIIFMGTIFLIILATIIGALAYFEYYQIVNPVNKKFIVFMFNIVYCKPMLTNIYSFSKSL